MDRRSKQYILAAVFVVGACSVGAIGEASQQYVVLCVLALIVGFCMSGGSVGMTALATGWYPTEVRATGTGWMLAIGRIGAILSALLGGHMLTLGWSMSDIFRTLVVPSVAAAIAVLAHGRCCAPSDAMTQMPTGTLNADISD